MFPPVRSGSRPGCSAKRLKMVSTPGASLPSLEFSWSAKLELLREVVEPLVANHESHVYGVAHLGRVTVWVGDADLARVLSRCVRDSRRVRSSARRRFARRCTGRGNGSRRIRSRLTTSHTSSSRSRRRTGSGNSSLQPDGHPRWPDASGSIHSLKALPKSSIPSRTHEQQRQDECKLDEGGSALFADPPPPHARASSASQRCAPMDSTPSTGHYQLG